MNKTAIELFAGVGGFRVGLNHITKINKEGKAIERGPWSFVYANQWEPATKAQDAFDCYKKRFFAGNEKEFSNLDISKVNKEDIPDHTLLTGGFPCQDYSVARSLKNEKGIEGKKGVLWWQINDILKAKKPKFVLLENVDRLLKAPAKQRGQAFGIILRCFADQGYGVQWRVINAADYGHPQRRRRTFIFAFHNSTKYYQSFSQKAAKRESSITAIEDRMFSKPFKCHKAENSLLKMCDIGTDDYPTLADVSEKFKFGFENTGYCLDYRIYTLKTEPFSKKKAKTLGECLVDKDIPDYCYHLNFEKFKYLKGSKHIQRTAKDGHKYVYSEGAIAFPDALDRPGRTRLTSEGTVNRSSHYICDPISHRYRILTPIECERLDEFPDDWTNTGRSSKRRYFRMGNALVTGLVRDRGDAISSIVAKEE